MRKECECEQCSSCSNAIVVLVCRGKEGAELKGEAFDSLFLTLTYGHELWVSTKTIRYWIQVVEISFLLSVVGCFLLVDTSWMPPDISCWEDTLDKAKDMQQ